MVWRLHRAKEPLAPPVGLGVACDMPDSRDAVRLNISIGDPYVWYAGVMWNSQSFQLGNDFGQYNGDGIANASS